MRKMLILAAILLTGIASVYAQTVYTFTGGGPNQNFTNVNNWDSNGVPPDTLQADDTIIIDATCTLNRRQVIYGTLVIDGVLNMTTGRNLLIYGEATVNGTLFKNDGALRIDGTLTNQGTITRSGPVDIIRNGGMLKNNGILNNTGDTLRIANTGATLENAGTLNNASGAIIEVRNSLVNTGTIINGGDITVFGNGDVLDNSGTLINNGVISRGNGAINNNSGAILQGSGTINMNGVTLVNNGTIAPGNSTGTLTITGDFTNNGTLDMEIDGLMSFDQLIVTGTATVNGTLAINFGTYVPMTGDVFPLISAMSFGGTPAVVITPSTVKAVYNSGTGELTITNIAQVYEFIGSGNWSVASNWKDMLIPPNPLTGIDTIFIKGSCNYNVGQDINANAVMIISSSGTLTLNSNTLEINAGGKLEIASGGLITLNSGGTIRINGGSLTVDGTLTRNAGTFTLQNSGSVTNNDVINNNGGTFTIANAGGTLTNNGTFLNAAGASISNGDQIINSASGTLLNEGSITITGGSDILANNGLLVNNGTITRTNGTFSNNAGATLSGIGTVDMNSTTFTNNGAIAPGNPPGMPIGTLTITGNFTNGTTGILNMQITGTSGVNDILAISGAATLGGTLNVALESGAVENAYSYNLLTYASRTGSFAAVNLPAPPMGSFWTVNNNATDFNITYAGGPALPIELISFTGQSRGEAIELNWRTGSEFNNDYMAVERSVNGIDFAEIGRVKGLGTTDGPADYRFTDAAPLQGVNYYRLRQVDFDGKTEIHRTISVVYDGQVRLGLTVFPNPVFDQLQLRWGGEANATAELRLFDFQGRLLHRESLPAGLLTHELPVHTLTPGPYVLQIAQGNVLETVRFVKQ